MKKQYVKRRPYRAETPEEFVYSLEDRGGYCRRLKTTPERRRNSADNNDRELKELGYTVRGSRRSDGALNPWSYDKVPKRNWKRSWKDFTKFEKQWMRDERPIAERKFDKAIAGIERMRALLETLNRDHSKLPPLFN